MTSIKREQKKDYMESETIAITGTVPEGNAETMTNCSGKKTEESIQIEELKKSQDTLNKKLMEVMITVQGNLENFERMSIDMLNFKKNVTEIKEKLGDDDMKSLELELKSCQK